MQVLSKSIKSIYFIWKIETHNSHFALNPYVGTIKEILGNNQDQLSTKIRGARLLFNTNLLFFGHKQCLNAKINVVELSNFLTESLKPQHRPSYRRDSSRLPQHKNLAQLFIKNIDASILASMFLINNFS